MISDADYQTWLSRDTPRCVLVEAKAYSGGAETTRYLSNISFTSRPSDGPANIAYEERIRAVPGFSAQLSELFTGSSLPSWGDLEIINESGSIDSWLNDAWDGRALKMYIGDPAWPKNDFRLVLDGVAADIYAKDRTTLALRLRDKTWRLNVPAQTSLIGGSTANANNPKPLCYGECFNVEPVLIDAALHKYQVHDGAINAISAVRDSGVAVSYTADASAGTFTLSTTPAGRVTADVQGAKPGGVYLTKCADIVQDLVTARSTLTAADIDTANFTAFNATCPQTLGLYVRARENLIPLIDSLVVSVGGFWTFSRAGMLQLGRLETPAGTPVISLTADDVAEDGISVRRRDLPVETYRVGYKKNFTVQRDGLAGAVTDADRAAYGAEYLVESSTNAGVKTAFLLAQNPDIDGTLIAGASDAAIEAARLAALFSVIRSVYEVDGYALPFKASLGNVVSLDHPRFGFAGGALAIVVGMVERTTNSKAKLLLWK